MRAVRLEREGREEDQNELSILLSTSNLRLVAFLRGLGTLGGQWIRLVHGAEFGGQPVKGPWVGCCGPLGEWGGQVRVWFGIVRGA